MNSRVVLGIYAALAWPVGLYTALWGAAWFSRDLPGVPYGLAAVVRVAGTIILLAAASATGLAVVRNPADRRRALGWFALGHSLVFGMMILQRKAIWPPGVSDWVLRAMFVVTTTLAYTWATAEGEPARGHVPLVGLFGGDGTLGDLRTRYELQIREAAAQEERNRLGRDLHDSVKQQIFAIHTAAAAAQARLGSDAPGAEAAIVQIRDSAREAMAEMEAMTDRLRATPLTNAGLIDALKKQCEATRFRTGAEVSFTAGRLPPDAAFAPGAQQALFRVAQEALANAARHARAAHIRVTLDSTADRVYVEVVDDGSGFDQATAPGGMGLANMRTRASEYRGELAVASRPGRGTDVRFSLPYETASAWDLRRRLVWTAALFGFLAAIATLSGRSRTSAMLWISLVTGALETIRLVTAWRRARRLKTETL